MTAPWLYLTTCPDMFTSCPNDHGMSRHDRVMSKWLCHDHTWPFTRHDHMSKWPHVQRRSHVQMTTSCLHLTTSCPCLETCVCHLIHNLAQTAWTKLASRVAPLKCECTEDERGTVFETPAMIVDLRPRWKHCPGASCVVYVSPDEYAWSLTFEPVLEFSSSGESCQRVEFIIIPVLSSTFPAVWGTPC